MHFQLELLTLIGQNLELCQMITLPSPVGILEENTSQVTNSGESFTTGCQGSNGWCVGSMVQVGWVDSCLVR